MKDWQVEWRFFRIMFGELTPEQRRRFTGLVAMLAVLATLLIVLVGLIVLPWPEWIAS